MDFAKKILYKYGWKDGDGLGKTKNGIKKPLRAHLKFDTSGFGADQAASDFNNHWWQKVFNEASNNIQINKNSDGQIKVYLKNTSEKKKATSSNVYHDFLSDSIISKDDNDKCEKIEKNEESAMSTLKVLTDDELFAACGGCTAHKGARHGLNLKGKLSRIEKQDQEFLEKMKFNIKNTNGMKKQHKKKKKDANYRRN